MVFGPRTAAEQEVVAGVVAAAHAYALSPARLSPAQPAVGCTSMVPIIPWSSWSRTWQW